MSNLKKRLNVHRIDYETEDMIWRANVLARDIPDMIEYIRMSTDKPIKVNNTETKDMVHAVTQYAKDLLKEEILDDIEKEQKEYERKTAWKCPWCEDDKHSYENAHALKMHIVKTHADSKKKSPKKRGRPAKKTENTE
jgi:hypothetical protein